jgi:beta-lactam-binding protein with PASTA domain
VVGLHRGPASDVLAQAGLVARISFAPVTDAGQVQRVVTQQPAAGTVVAAGSEVTLLIGSKKATSG